MKLRPGSAFDKRAPWETPSHKLWDGVSQVVLEKLPEITSEKIE